MYFLYDWTYLLIIPGALFAMWAQWRVSSAMHRFSAVATRRGLTGAEVAQRILESAGITNVAITTSQGFLSDHYHPLKRELALSPDVHNGSSVASIGIAAHECGHALQHARGYAPLTLRSALVPAAALGSNVSWLLFIAGIIIAGMGSASDWGRLLMDAGIALFGVAVLFTFVTLPVEFDASRRAALVLEEQGLADGGEIDGVRTVLNAAALTYVAAAAMAVLQLIRLLLIRRSYDRD
ncbi:MAG: zinc metallopeptidase [Planctomycetes bacterium]|nr:zinc metallopeptidase [Planctomycetota bacterium]